MYGFLRWFSEEEVGEGLSSRELEDKTDLYLEVINASQGLSSSFFIKNGVG